MARASQRHKLAIRGYNSIGERTGILREGNQWGSNTLEATILVEGRWASTDTGTVTTSLDGGADVVSNYSPASDEDAVAAAAGLAAAINAQIDHTALADGNLIRITKTTAGTVQITSYTVA